MIAASTISDAVPQVRFPVAWPVAVANDAPGIGQNLQCGIGIFWGHIAPVVEIARTNGAVGVLRVTLEATAAIATTNVNGETWLMANAIAVWVDEPLPADFLADLSPGELAAIQEPTTEYDVTLVVAVLADGAHILIDRVRASRPHAEHLAAAVGRHPNYRTQQYVVVALADALPMVGGAQ